MELFDFTERTCLLLGGERVARLAASSVLVFGMGGVGSYCVEALARCGVGRLTLVDGDRVERSNLNRQLIALRSTMGMFKCDAARSRILDINPEAHVEIQNVFYTEENAELLDFGEFDYVADAVDMIRAKVLIAERAKHAGVPVISAKGAGNRLDPCRITITDLFRTQGGPLARVMRKALRDRGISSLKVVFSDEPPRKAPGGTERIVGSVSFVPAAAGLAMASAIVRDLCGFPDAQLFTGNDFRD